MKIPGENSTLGSADNWQNLKLIPDAMTPAGNERGRVNTGFVSLELRQVGQAK